MPNYTHNEIHAGNAVLDTIAPSGIVDFNAVIPMPHGLDSVLEGTETSLAIVYYCSERLSIPEQETDIRIRSLNDNPFRLVYTGLWYPRLVSGERAGFTDDQLYSLGETYIDNLSRHGGCTWYDWSVKFWGTKWNALDSVRESGKVSFLTAWSAPFPVFEKLCEMFPDEPLSFRWRNEGDDWTHAGSNQSGKLV